LQTEQEKVMHTGRLILVLGDQLDRRSPALLAADKAKDIVAMLEVRNESKRVWSHKARTVLFLSAMRHFAAWLATNGFRVEYTKIDDASADSFSSALETLIRKLEVPELVMTEAGEHGVQEEISAVCRTCNIEMNVLPDSHFLCSLDEFRQWREGRKSLVMEHFYRNMRQRLGILMEDGKPAGGNWNFDRDNRKHFGKQGPGLLPPWPEFEPDSITQQVMQDVSGIFPDNPGELESFNWPVTRDQALVQLEYFIANRLPAFGPFQDAMWQDEAFLYHSGLASSLNLKLLSPREVIDRAVSAYETGDAPIGSVEGFVRQLLGWREYVRGLYWTEMPDYLDCNALDADASLPAFYWNGKTDMACLKEVIGQTLKYGYAHHIQRLMVTGLFAMLLGVRPREIHAWYLAVYVDAVEWVELPNTFGMTQYADGGLLASKPYAASGRYIQRMSNYCAGCRFRPDQSTGDRACPFTTLYWDFLMRHEKRFADHPRAAMQWRMLNRLDAGKRKAIRARAAELKVLFADLQ
jgi:deoxyribodipyrimidine photolyase-related protein